MIQEKVKQTIKEKSQKDKILNNFQNNGHTQKRLNNNNIPTWRKQSKTALTNFQSYLQKSNKYKPQFFVNNQKDLMRQNKKQNKDLQQEINFMQSLFKKQSNNNKKSNQSFIIQKEQKEQNYPLIKRGSFDNPIICSKCSKKFTMNQIQEFVYADLCLHPLCKKCMQRYLDNQYLKATGKYKYPCPYLGCHQEIPYYQLAQVFGQNKMEQIQNQLNFGFMNQLITCIKCKSKFEFSKGRSEDAPKVDNQGKKLNQKYIEEFAEFRFLCPNCKTDQCRNCNSAPYHIGKTCQQFKTFKNQKKCRFCLSALKPGYTSVFGIRAFDDICDHEQCLKKTKAACSKINKCGHSCFGCIKEKQCMPCLKNQCSVKFTKELNGVYQDSYCNICFIQGLGNAPCIKIKCGHIFHYQCLQNRLKTKWFGPRILFNFCQCPLCNKYIEVPQECDLSKMVNVYKVLKNEIRTKALQRLKFQGQDKNQKLIDPKSSYYKNQQKYAMAIYAYFQCFKCKKPYFGGRKSCADAMNGNQNPEQFKPDQLICPQCCPIQTKNCQKHGKQFINFKCKFCCSIAQWLCWGNTHFCQSCHKKQVDGQYLTKLSKQKLPQCQGPGKCPVGGNHDGNGQTRSLGCAICVDFKKSNQNF